MRPERIVESLNHGLRDLLSNDPKIVLLGEDVADPYGGAFKVTRGLSSDFPDRVLSTPISENALLGFAAGLSLQGFKPVVEFMFGDFMALAFDQLLNFASKAVSMYGSRQPINMLVRCPVGGGRSYGPTHSQSMQKFVLGIPHLELFELNPFVDPSRLLARLANRGVPCVLFEDKASYGKPRCADGRVDELFQYTPIEGAPDSYRVSLVNGGKPDCLLLATGSVLERCLEAARRAFLEDEIETEIVVMTQLFPLQLDPIQSWIRRASRVMVVEESSPGGTWGSEISTRIHQRLWRELRAPVGLLQSKNAVIPAAQHLERRVLLQSDDVRRAISGGMGDASD